MSARKYVLLQSVPEDELEGDIITTPGELIEEDGVEPSFELTDNPEEADAVSTEHAHASSDSISEEVAAGFGDDSSIPASHSEVVAAEAPATHTEHMAPDDHHDILGDAFELPTDDPESMIFDDELMLPLDKVASKPPPPPAEYVI